jgi:hypothetical protein
VRRGERDESLRPYSRLSRPEPLLFLPSSSSVVLYYVCEMDVCVFVGTYVLE